jgi:hypothetical protein
LLRERSIWAEPSSATPKAEFQPKTPLGRRFWELRKQIVASGEPLLEPEDVERELADCRGGAASRIDDELSISREASHALDTR